MKAGYIIIDKEKDLTSFSCVNKVKKLSKLKAGHTGTLDPMAEGVLPILLGSATKLTEMIMEGEKEYIAGGLFGYSTDTLDVTGTKTKEVDINEVKVTKEELLDVLKLFLGQVEQVPPMYSALKKDGRRLYDLAREGIEVEREKRKITISSIELLDFTYPRFTIKIRCSKGTYIRTLIDDIGEKLKVPSVMETLVRTATGKFKIEDSVKISKLDSENIVTFIHPIEELFLEYDNIVVDKGVLKLLINGVKIKDKSITSKFKEDTCYRIQSEEEEFIGILKKMDGTVNLIYRV